MISKLFLVTLGSLLLFSGSAMARPATFADLDGNSYVATAIKGNKKKPKEMRISFGEGQLVPGEDAESPLLLVSGGCNAMAFGYTLERGVVKWTRDGYSTLVGCVPNPDFWTMKRFRKGMKAEIKGRWLIFSRGSAVRIWFKPQR